MKKEGKCVLIDKNEGNVNNMKKSYTFGELLHGIGYLIVAFVVIGLPVCLQNNMNYYIAHTFVKVEAAGYETPYDIIEVNGDNTVTIYYKNLGTTVPYKKIDNASFSFLLPFDNKEYSVTMENISSMESNQNSKPEIKNQNTQNMIQPARGEGLFTIPHKVVLVKNSSGFIQVLIDNKDQLNFNQKFYGLMIAGGFSKE